MAGFMELQVWKAAAEEHDGVLYPQDMCGEGCPCPDSHGSDCDLPSTSAGQAWFARYSAPGYLDRTDPVYSTTGPIDAARQAFETYGSDSEQERRELAQVIRQARAQGFRR
jgi:hypothetical protein